MTVESVCELMPHKESEQRRKYHREYQRAWRKKNLERVREYRRKYRLEHVKVMATKPRLTDLEKREKRRAYAREYARKYRLENYEACLAANRAWSRKNPEKHRECQRKSKLKNREKILATTRKLRARNLERYRKYANDWNRSEAGRNSYLKRVYGITLVDLRKLIAAQNGVCPICELPVTDRGDDIDHDHATGKVRGVLHPNCNAGIGMLKDDALLCERAAAYLRVHKNGGSND